jgi:hypothetical protein
LKFERDSQLFDTYSSSVGLQPLTVYQTRL